ncbi:hypothetical protein [Streptomyces sp. NPDC016845]|uniref:hypothetical protein n=1 Tax=Streptomyces sp. NPDC016845 TaxID=3364972 RepID=UPI0037948532
MALDGAGRAFVADGNSGRLLNVDLATGKTSEVATGLGDTTGVALDGHGYADSTDPREEKLWKVDLATGRKTAAATGLGSHVHRPWTVTVLPTSPTTPRESCVR